MVASEQSTPTMQSRKRQSHGLLTPEHTPTKAKRARRESITVLEGTSSLISASPGDGIHVRAVAGPMFETPVKKVFVQERNVYAQARSMLRLSASSTTQLVGRDVQRTHILNFLSSRLPSVFPLSDNTNRECTPSGALYIYGTPGTGKTALVTSLVQEHEIEKRVHCLVVNCTTLSSDAELVRRVHNEMASAKDGMSTQDYKSCLTELFTRADATPLLLILDEMDHLKDEATMMFFFEQAALANSRLALIGIANTLTLSARLSQQMGSSFDSLDFPAYTDTDMSTIGKQRLMSLYATLEQPETGLPLVAPPALELASRKVAKSTGDLRTFLAVLRKAIELAEPKTPASPSLTTFTLATAPKASPGHVLKALKACQLSASTMQPSAIVDQALTEIGLQSRLALASLCVALSRNVAMSQQPTTPCVTSSAIKAKPAALNKPKQCSQPSIVSEEAWGVYNDALSNAAKEEFIQSRSDWENLIDNLSVLGLVNASYVASPTSSPTSSKTKAKTPSPSAKRNSKTKQKVIELRYDLTIVSNAIKTSGNKEACLQASAVLDMEARRQARKLKVWEHAAPMAGFNGNGLEGKEAELIGQHGKNGRNVDEEEESWS